MSDSNKPNFTRPSFIIPHLRESVLYPVAWEGAVSSLLKGKPESYIIQTARIVVSFPYQEEPLPLDLGERHIQLLEFIAKWGPMALLPEDKVEELWKRNLPSDLQKSLDVRLSDDEIKRIFINPVLAEWRDARDLLLASNPATLEQKTITEAAQAATREMEKTYFEVFSHRKKGMLGEYPAERMEKIYAALEGNLSLQNRDIDIHKSLGDQASRIMNVYGEPDNQKRRTALRPIIEELIALAEQNVNNPDTFNVKYITSAYALAYNAAGDFDTRHGGHVSPERDRELHAEIARIQNETLSSLCKSVLENPQVNDAQDFIYAGNKAFELATKHVSGKPGQNNYLPNNRVLEFQTGILDCMIGCARFFQKEGPIVLDAAALLAEKLKDPDAKTRRIELIAENRRKLVGPVGADDAIITSTP